jgi:two-component system OmpR family response regulator
MNGLLDDQKAPPNWSSYRKEGERRSMKILVIEDNEAMATYVSKGLRQEGYVVDHVASGVDGLHCGKSGSYDLIVCDVLLPDLDGIMLVRKLRMTHPQVPVLFLSSCDNVDDRVRGLSAGGDDYLTKPFSFSELVARIEALLRRQGQALLHGEELTLGDLRLDLVRRKVYREKQEIRLQPLELQLLEYMMRHPGRVLSKTVIMEKIWDFNFDPESNVVEVRIHHLRSKVDKPFSKPLIHTVRGVGYVLEER